MRLTCKSFRVPLLVCIWMAAIRVIIYVHSLFQSSPNFSHELFVSNLRVTNETVYQQWEPCSITTRTAGRDPLDGRWYNFSSLNFQFYAYSAFLDYRPSLMSQPVIRIIAIASNQREVLKRNVWVTLFCRLYYEGDTTVRIVPMVRQHRPTSFGGYLRNKEAREYLYTCGLDDAELGFPIAVSVLRSQHEDKTNYQLVKSCMPVEIPSKPATPRDFAICVPVLYGKLRPRRLIEWLEMQKLLGVSFVEIHALNVSQPALNVFEHYAKEGFLKLRYSNFIYPPDGTFNQRTLHSTPAVNDCMYRHMHSFKRMLILDVDELIIPDNFTTLQDLVEFLDHSLAARPINYVFRNSHFFFDISTNNTYANGRSYDLILLKYRMKAELSPPGHGVKSIINPQACVIMHNHYCWDVTPGYEHRPTSREIDPVIATNRHYKRCNCSEEILCPNTAQRCKQMLATVTYDGVMLKFADEFEKRVRSRMTNDFKRLIMAGDNAYHTW